MENNVDTVCEKDKCNGCMACNSVCKRNAIQVKDEIRVFNSYIDDAICVRCGLCKKNCPQNRLPNLMPVIQWWQGWSNDESVRIHASSGGVATELTRSFLINGGYVCSCVFTHGQFLFMITNKIEKAYKYAGSKYVKSNPIGIYKDIEYLLRNGKRVLFIGLPCQSAGLYNVIPNELRKSLYRIDLICHGTPSYSLLNKHIKEIGYDIKKLDTISFREKTKFKLTISNSGVKRDIVEDIYLMGFLSGKFYTENCYECVYAGASRVSDISIGDSWGSELKDELKKGLSLIMCQTEKGMELIKNSNLILKEVDKEKAILANQQLRQPFERTKKTTLFFKIYQKTNNFGLSYFLTEPNKILKRQIKYILVKLHLYKPFRNH